MSSSTKRAVWADWDPQTARFHKNAGLSLRQRARAISTMLEATLPLLGAPDIRQRQTALARLLLAEALREFRRVPTWPRLQLVAHAEAALCDITGQYRDRASRLARSFLKRR